MQDKDQAEPKTQKRRSVTARPFSDRPIAGWLSALLLTSCVTAVGIVPIALYAREVGTPMPVAEALLVSLAMAGIGILDGAIIFVFTGGRR